jgi:hypothetical protein
LAASPNEGDTQTKVRGPAVTATRLFVKVFSNGLDAPTTIAIRINGANGNLQVSIPAGTHGIFEDATHSDALASGDLVDFLIDSSASTTGDLIYQALAVAL